MRPHTDRETTVTRILSWICRRAVWVVVLVALATAVLASRITTLVVEVDPDAQLPQEHPYIAALGRLNELFGEKNLVFVGLFPTEGDVYTPEFLASLARVTERVAGMPGLVERSFSSLALAKATDMRATEDGMAVEPILGAPPRTREEALRVRERVLRNPQYAGWLVAADGSAAAITADFELRPPLDGYPEIRIALERILAEENDGTYTAHLGGPVIYVAWLAHYSERMFLFFPLALLVIALVHYEAFRTAQAMFLPLLTAVLAMVWSLGLLGLLGVTLDPFNVTTPILILAVAAGHAVQMLKRYYEELAVDGSSTAAVIRAGERVGPVMIVAGGIAAASFLSLLGFETAAIRNFGLFTALGILSALAIEMTLIPAVRVLLPTPGERERRRERARHPFDACVERFAALTVGSRPWWVLLVAGVLAVVAGAAITAIRVDSSFRRQFASGAQVRIDDAALNRAFGGTSTLVMLVDSGAEGGVDEPELLGALARIQAWLDVQPDVGKTLSIVDFVRRMHAVLAGDEPAAGELPGSRELVAQYWLLYSMSAAVEDFDTIVDREHRVTAVRAFLHDDRTEAAEALIARLRERLADELPAGVGVEITGSLASSHAMNEVMVRGKVRNVVQIAALIVLVSAAVLRSWLGGLLVALPLAFAVLTNFATMALVGVPLDIGTSAISAMAVGIGADYAIYFLFRLREELAAGVPLEEAVARTLRTSGKAILFVSTAIAAGYLTLCGSGFGYHVRLGSLVAFAMIVSSVASLTVLPAAIVVLRPRFLGAGVRAIPPGDAAAARTSR